MLRSLICCTALLPVFAFAETSQQTIIRVHDGTGSVEFMQGPESSPSWVTAEAVSATDPKVLGAIEPQPADHGGLLHKTDGYSFGSKYGYEEYPCPAIERLNKGYCLDPAGTYFHVPVVREYVYVYPRASSPPPAYYEKRVLVRPYAEYYVRPYRIYRYHRVIKTW